MHSIPIGVCVVKQDIKKQLHSIFKSNLYLKNALIVFELSIEHEYQSNHESNNNHIVKYGCPENSF